MRCAAGSMASQASRALRGPGKVINAIQQETGTDISLDEAEGIATVTIGGKETEAVEAARQRIDLILNPPSAEVGAIYTGKVVGIAKFGAFVNILPGRDGLLHISKIGGGKRIERVEDVLMLGQELTVVVDDIDPAGKLSLSLVKEATEAEGDEGDEGDEVERPRGEEVLSFEDAFENELLEEYGDLGPGAEGGRGERSAARPRRNRPRREGRR